MTTISVIIPALNEEDALDRCLESLHQQTRMPDEIIVVDNGSADATKDVAKSHGVKVIEEAKRGIMPATYTGMAASTGDIIARCDADSILPPDWIETILSELNNNPDAAGITGPGKFYGTSSIAAQMAQFWYMYSYFILAGSALANWPLFGSNFAIRRSTWEHIKDSLHRDRADIHDDMDMSIHIRPTERILFRPRLAVGISARSLQTSGLKLRLHRGIKSFTLHWPEQSPRRRWEMKLFKNIN